MSNSPKPKRTQRPPIQPTLDTLGAAGQAAEYTAQGQIAPAPLPPTTPDFPPELAGLQGYEIVKELGRGGMGVVYLARNKLINRPEVLKVMNKALVGRPEAVERFLQEIRSAGRLSHPNVAMVHSAHQIGDLLVLAMEYVDGDDLAKVVRQRGALPIRNACFCVHQAAVALQRGHELGMVHRDIKPGNILLAKQGNRQAVKVIDFGLAKAKSEATSDRDLTATNQMMGTPGYSAPEQLNDAKTADTRSDIYALGCTLYCLLAGEPPFKGNSALAVALAQEAATVRPLRELRPEVPEALAGVVNKMMTKDPAGRFGVPAEVAAALVPFIKVPDSGGKSSELPPTTSQAVPGPSNQLSETGAGVAAAGTALPDGRVGLTTSLPERRTSGSKKRFWLTILIGAAMLLGIVGLGGVVLRVRTQNGAVVIENVPSDADVRVDGEKIAVSHNGDTVTVNALADGPHKLKVMQNGNEILSSDVTVKLGGDPVRLRVEPSKSAGNTQTVTRPGDNPSAQAGRSDFDGRGGDQAPAVAATPRLTRGGRGGFGGFGASTNDPARLLLNKSVQDELKLSDELKADLQRIQEKQSANLLKATASGDREKAREVMKSISEDTKKELEKTKESLKPEQAKRLEQIHNQVGGVWAFANADVQKQLRLTDRQKNEIKEITEGLTKDTRKLFSDAAGDQQKMQDVRKNIDALQKQRMEQISRLLTEVQKETWKQITGEKFELKPETKR